MKTWLIPVEALKANYTRLLDKVDEETKHSVDVEVHLKYLLANVMEPAIFGERVDEIASDLAMFGFGHIDFDCLVMEVSGYLKTYITQYTGMPPHLFEGNWHLDFPTRTLSVSAYC